MGGVDLSEKDAVLRSVLLDLSQNATIDISAAIAEQVLQGLSGVGKTHKNHVERAAFTVLKSPDVPSDSGGDSIYLKSQRGKTAFK